MIGANPIATQNNTIVTFHLDDEECGSERRAPYGELHGDDASSLHWVALHAVQCQVGSHDLIIFSSKLLEHRIWHQVDRNTVVDKHSRNRPRVNATSNVQRLQALARPLGLLEHDLLRTKAQLNDLLLDSPELGRQREDHVDIRAGR
jgi:hypothetical protein